MTKKQIIVTIVIALITAAGGFFGGVKYQKSKTPARFTPGQFTAGAAGAGFGAGRQGGGAARGGMGLANGQIISKDDTSLTIKLMTGGSQIILVSPSTQYRKTVDGSTDDAAVGTQVTVTGTSNSDGSLTAQSVQIRPATTTPTTLQK